MSWNAAANDGATISSYNAQYSRNGPQSIDGPAMDAVVSFHYPCRFDGRVETALVAVSVFVFP